MTTEKILESLTDLVPEDVREKVSSAVSALLDDVNAEYEEKYNARLKEAYDEMATENADNVKKAVNSYEQAYAVIDDLRKRLEVQKEEFESHMLEEYEHAYQELLKEREKNEELEGRLYEEYDGRLKDIKEYMVDKIDQFLAIQGDKFYEMAKQEVLNDPCLAEHKVAFDKIMDVVGDYVNDEEIMLNTSSKVDNLNGRVEKLSKEKRMLEAKIMRLESDKTKLNEIACEAQKLLEEQMLNEEKEWVKRGHSVEGRGEVADKKRQIVLGEYASEETKARDVNTTHNQKQDTIVEQWQVLAGMKNEE